MRSPSGRSRSRSRSRSKESPALETLETPAPVEDAKTKVHEGRELNDKSSEMASTESENHEKQGDMEIEEQVTDAKSTDNAESAVSADCADAGLKVISDEDPSPVQTFSVNRTDSAANTSDDIPTSSTSTTQNDANSAGSAPEKAERTEESNFGTASDTAGSEVVNASITDQSAVSPIHGAQSTDQKAAITPTGLNDSTVDDFNMDMDDIDDEIDAEKESLADDAPRDAHMDDKSTMRKKIVKSRSVWMLFCNDQRANGNMALSSTAPLRELYKTLGDKYRKLTKEEKKPYIDMALADKKRYERELAELKSHMAENPGIYQAYPPELQAKFGLYDLRSHAGLFFQLGRVTTAIKIDPDVKGVDKYARVAITKATELFVACFSEAVKNYAAGKGKSCIQERDILCHVHAKDNLDFLRLEFPKRLLSDTAYGQKRGAGRPKQIPKMPISYSYQQNIASSIDTSRVVGVGLPGVSATSGDGITDNHVSNSDSVSLTAVAEEGSETALEN